MFNREKFVPEREMQKIQPVHRLRAWSRINLPEITNSFQHSLEGDRRRGEKAFSKARVPPTRRRFLSSLHLRAVHLALPLAFYRSFLRPPRKFPQFLSLLIHPPPGAFILLLSFKRPTRRDAPGKKFAVVLFGA